MDSEAELSLVIKAKNLASREVDKLHGAMRRLGGGVKAVGGALKTLVEGGILGLIAAGVAVAATLLGSTKAAAEEQVGINRLNATLKANVKGHLAQKKAIEDVIAKRETLAFSDDDLRDSLSTLITKYGDIDKAEKIQRVAMDVARLKGISLADATNLVSKGLDGNAKVLKQLGIEVGKHATKQEILTAIQKKAAGQAELYGKSAAGAQEAFGIALQDVIEDIGAGLTPIMTQAFTWLRTVGIPAVRAVIAAIGHWVDQNRPLINTIGKIASQAADKLKPVLAAIADFVTGTLVPAISKLVSWLWGDGKGPLPTAFGAISDFVDNVLVPAFNGMIDVLKTVIGWISSLIGWVKDALDALGTLSKSIPDVVGKAGPGIGPGRSGAFGPGHAEGGWVGLHGPEYALVGERGPEFVRKNGTGTGDDGGVTLKGVSRRSIQRMIDEGLYFQLQRAGTGA